MPARDTPRWTAPSLPSGLPIGDGWRATAETRPVRFPFDGATVADVAWGDVADAEAALAAAHDARRAAARTPAHQRRTWLTDAGAALAEARDELVDLLVLETGKPIRDCRVEVARALSTLAGSAEEASRVSGETVRLDAQATGEGLIGWWTREPVGVVVGITGFNYPLLLAAHKVGPAIAAGCPIIIKPAPQTPMTTLRLVAALRDAGCPGAYVQVVTGGVEVGDLLVRDRRTAAVSFTGSAGVGHQIAANAGAKRVVLELGSNAALVVAEDADLEAAADACVRGGMYASGQACISVQRVIVHRDVVEAFTPMLRDRIAAIVVGDPRDEATQVAAVIDERSGERIGAWIDDAVSAGASLLAGGSTDGATVRPTVLVDVPGGTSAWDEEIFGPVLVVRVVADFDEAIATANDSAYGLHVSVFTRDLARAFQAAADLEAGGVLINEVPGFRADNMPYGGVKMSGMGREGPRYAVEEFTVTKMIMVRPTTA